MSHRRIGFKPSLVTQEEHQKLEVLLNNPVNEITAYTELLEWVQSELNKDMKYITLLKYVQRKFKTKIKVARKNDVKKANGSRIASKNP